MSSTISREELCGWSDLLASETEEFAKVLKRSERNLIREQTLDKDSLRTQQSTGYSSFQESQIPVKHRMGLYMAFLLSLSTSASARSISSRAQMQAAV